MKRWAIISILLVSLTMVAANACSGGDAAETTQQLAKVERGDLALTVTGDGSIKASRDARLSFGSGGKVDSIYVDEGDKVKEGDVLARLDTSSLELARAQAEVALTQAQVTLTQAQVTQKTAEQNLKDTRNTEDSLKQALLDAQIDVRSAEYDLEQTRELYHWSDIETARSNVDDAEETLEEALRKLGEYATLTEDGQYIPPEEGTEEIEGYKVWQKAVVQAQKRLDTAEATLRSMLSGNDLEEVAIDKLELESARMTEAQAQKDLDELNDDIALKQLELDKANESLDHARQSVELARQSLEQAQKDLDEATIIAPFDGVVASIGAKEGDTVSSPATAAQPIVYLVDADAMELLVELDEIDIPEVELGQEAIIEIDALPDAEITGRVVAIYPVPTTESGVVLYNVKIELDSKKNPGVMIGMTASADIVIDRRSNTLIVPERAINENDKGENYVRVMIDGKIQERTVVTGLSDDFQIEILSGLDEGETVVVETKAKTSSSSELGFF
jgi:HlyD family secretion protein